MRIRFYALSISMLAIWYSACGDTEPDPLLCKDGETRCTSQQIQQCVREQWHVQLDCTNYDMICSSAKGEPSCTPGSIRDGGSEDSDFETDTTTDTEFSTDTGSQETDTDQTPYCPHECVSPTICTRLLEGVVREAFECYEPSSICCEIPDGGV